jgi:hypothetical protein
MRWFRLTALLEMVEGYDHRLMRSARSRSLMNSLKLGEEE